MEPQCKGSPWEEVMIVDMKRVVIELERREMVPVEDARGGRIVCLRGRIWITEYGSTGDIVLEAGESYKISREGVAVVQALRDARVVLRAPVLSPASAGLAARVEQLWGRWTAPVAGGCAAIARPPGGLTRTLAGS
jgi:Protein of unknown function (DUF2917)